MKTKNRSRIKARICTLFVLLLLSQPITTLGFQFLPIPLPEPVVFPPVPTADSAIRTKEAGITFLGVTIPGITWDGILITAVRLLLDQMTDDIVSWINNRDGNDGPAFAVDLEGYLIDIADAVGGRFIEEIGAGKLCSPFSFQVEEALWRKLETSSARSSDFYQNSCTLSDVIGNVENFFEGDFDAGGWNMWYSVTQEVENSPYSALLDAQAALTDRVQGRQTVEQTIADWGKGFLSSQECEDPGPSASPEDCERFVVTTPGTIIEEQLQRGLGAEIDQLNLADEFDEILGALAGRLMGEVFSSDGLIAPSGSRTPWAGGGRGGGGGSGSIGSCFADKNNALVGDLVTWTLRLSSSINTVSDITWAGEGLDGPPPRKNTVEQVTYTTPGLKTASVTIVDTITTAGADGTPTTETRTQVLQCQPQVDVDRYGPIEASCILRPPKARIYNLGSPHIGFGPGAFPGGIVTDEDFLAHYEVVQEDGTTLGASGGSGAYRYGWSYGHSWLGGNQIMLTTTGTLVNVSVPIIYGQLSDGRSAAYGLPRGTVAGATNLHGEGLTNDIRFSYTTSGGQFFLMGPSISAYFTDPNVDTGGMTVTIRDADALEGSPAVALRCPAIDLDDGLFLRFPPTTP